MCTYGCWCGARWLDAECSLLDGESGQVPDGAKSPRSAPPQPPNDLQDESGRSLQPDCPAVRSQSGEEEEKLLESETKKKIAI